MAKDATIAVYESGTTTAVCGVDTFGNRPQLATGDVVAMVWPKLFGGRNAGGDGWILRRLVICYQNNAGGEKKTTWRMKPVIILPMAGSGILYPPQRRQAGI